MSSIRIGWSAPTTVALAIVVSLTALKNNARSRPRASPPGAASRSRAHVSRPPRAASQTSTTTEYIHIR